MYTSFQIPEWNIFIVSKFKSYIFENYMVPSVSSNKVIIFEFKNL